MELTMVERGVQPALSQEFVMSTSLDNLALPENEDIVGELDGMEMMGNDKTCPPNHKSLQRLQYKMLGLRVQPNSRLVQH
jgi:hypothetical protein